jgi:uncharacterized protein (TIGR02145 family)
MSITHYFRIIISLLFVVLLFPASCTDKIVPEPEGSEGEDVPVIINMQGLFGGENSANTYSLTYAGEGTGEENRIKDVTIFVFNSSNACEKIIKRTPFSFDNDNPIGPELVKSGNKRFVVVANGDENYDSFYDEQTEPSDVESYGNFVRKLTKELSGLPEPPYLMTGEASSYLEPLKPNDNPNKINIELKRAVAKVKIYISKSDKAATHKIEMQSITLNNGADRVSLLAPVLGSSIIGSSINYGLTSFKNEFSTQDGNVPNNDDANYCMLKDTIYVYESLCGSDTSKAIYFDLEAKVNSNSIRKARFYLAGQKRDSFNDTVYNITRNNWYNVYLDIRNPGLDSLYITVKSARWNLAAIQDTTVGIGYEVKMASPFKLVKNYTQTDMALDPKIAAIDKHSKGASWLDLTVTNGHGWELKFPNEDTVSYFSIDSGATWVHSSVTGTGDDGAHRIYVYRPYKENAEPNFGPSFILTVAGQEVRDFVVQPRDTVPVPTNSYILRPQLPGTPSNESRAYIPLKGVYRYWEDRLYANEDYIPTGTVEAELLWQDRDPAAGYVVDKISVINADNRDEAYIYAEAGSVQGNAVIVMKVNGGTYWSFHLWVTEYNPYEAAGQKLYNGLNKGIVFMDRNLGALNNKYDAEGEARGLYYQYGRSVPFPRSVNWEGGIGSSIVCYKSPNTTQEIKTGILPVAIDHESDPTLPPLERIQMTLQNPLRFYTDADPWPSDWEDTCLWSTKEGNKTAFDPCPEGWRIPEQVGWSSGSPWEDEFILLGLNEGEIGYENGRYHAAIGYYPYTGYLDAPYGKDGTVEIAGTSTTAYYWTSYRYDVRNTAGGLYINYHSVDPWIHITRTFGVSVRCVVDENYLRNTPGGGLFRNSEIKDKIKP